MIQIKVGPSETSVPSGANNTAIQKLVLGVMSAIFMAFKAATSSVVASLPKFLFACLFIASRFNNPYCLSKSLFSMLCQELCLSEKANVGTATVAVLKSTNL
eukprot:2877112-Ditylum_brightwellii.AAC.1